MWKDVVMHIKDHYQAPGSAINSSVSSPVGEPATCLPPRGEFCCGPTCVYVRFFPHCACMCGGSFSNLQFYKGSGWNDLTLCDFQPPWGMQCAHGSSEFITLVQVQVG